MHSWAPCQCKNGAAAVGAGQKFLRMQGAGGEILRVRASWPGPGPVGRLPLGMRRSVQAGRPGERLSPASGPLRGTRPEETRRQMRRPPLRPAQARMTSQKQPGPRRPETAATSPPDLHRPGMAATRPGSTRPRLLAAQAHHRGPRRLPRRGSLADRAARRVCRLPSVSLPKRLLLPYGFPDRTPTCVLQPAASDCSPPCPAGAACAPPAA